MATTTARGNVPQGLQTTAERLCICGCRRSIAHKRRDAQTFDSSCRVRLLRDRGAARIFTLGPPICRCGNRIAEVDPDGDLCCTKCGHQLAHVSRPISGFDATAWLMVTDSDGQVIRPARRRLPSPWRLAVAA